MFLRSTLRKKDGKEHEYFSIVENKRAASGKVVQRHVLYLGEINSHQQEAWRKTIDGFLTSAFLCMRAEIGADISAEPAPPMTA